ncbi:MAG: EVE domain-containing protein, partial [Pyrinomonadaceae bacterium]
MAWVFQGSPDKYGIDDYVARYPELIYWRTPRYAAEIKVGDRAFIWRSGTDSGAVAIGSVVEVPTPGTKVKHPEALGDDLWSVEKPDLSEARTGIRLDEVRLTASEQMLRREIVKGNTILAQSTLIRMPSGTVFRLSPEEATVFAQLWGVTDCGVVAPAAASEGERRLRSHYKRERSLWLRERKLAQFVTEHGHLFCELCREQGGARYPVEFGDRIFEVHHRAPLALADAPVRTTLEALSVLCANCHRTVHASA